jgi:hypothetical protein
LQLPRLRRPRPRPKQWPPLPEVVFFPADEYPRGPTWMGLQPWIVPQAKAIAAQFGLRVTEGWGDHPPHARRSDHRWGGAIDLVGAMPAMVACNVWANRFQAEPWRPGKVFRWVGGPARDASGVEPGHADHVHLSWYRYGPATSVFDTPLFRD